MQTSGSERSVKIQEEVEFSSGHTDTRISTKPMPIPVLIMIAHNTGHKKTGAAEKIKDALS